MVCSLALVSGASWRPIRLEPHFWIERSTRKEGRPRPTSPVSLNAATATELLSLPGIGPVLAERIVAYRERTGPFLCVGDLRKVTGIGPAKLERLRPHIEVGRASKEVDQIANPQSPDQQEGVEIAR